MNSFKCALSQRESGLRPLSHTREHLNETTGKSYHDHRLNRLEKKLIQVDTEKVIQKVRQQLTYSGHADREPSDISPQLQLNLQTVCGDVFVCGQSGESVTEGGTGDTLFLNGQNGHGLDIDKQVSLCLHLTTTGGIHDPIPEGRSCACVSYGCRELTVVVIVTVFKWVA